MVQLRRHTRYQMATKAISDPSLAPSHSSFKWRGITVMNIFQTPLNLGVRFIGFYQLDVFMQGVLESENRMGAIFWLLIDCLLLSRKVMETWDVLTTAVSQHPSPAFRESGSRVGVSRSHSGFPISASQCRTTATGVHPPEAHSSTGFAST